MTALTAQLMQIAQPKTQADKLAVVSFAIAHMVKMGIPLNRAMDAVLGDGTFAEIAADVYTALRGSVETLDATSRDETPREIDR